MYVDKDYTFRQILIRALFAIVSLVIFMAYATKLICRVKSKHKKYLTT